MRQTLLLVIALLVSVSPLALALGVQYLAIIGIEGLVNVNEDAITVKEIPVKLDINEPTGVEKIKDITTITVQKGWAIKFKVIKRNVEGNMTIVLNGFAILRSMNKIYKIPLPCLLAHGEGCMRVLTLIPGYDIPLPVLPGTYTVDLVLDWKASGKGRFIIKLAIELHKLYTVNPEIRVVGARPNDTEGWIIVPGSTKSYALMIERTRVEVGDKGTGTVRAYAWVFAENFSSQRVFFKFRLVDAVTHQVVTELVAKPYRTSMYHSVLVEVIAPPGEYLLRLEITRLAEPIILEIPLKFYK